MTSLPFRRRSEAGSADHERARTLAGERLVDALLPDDEAWLSAHLAKCETCARIAVEYEEQHEAFAGLRTPEPPRELWARTAAALDREDRRRRGSRWAASSGPERGHDRSRPNQLVPLGVAVGALVVAALVGRSFFEAETGPVPSLGSGNAVAASPGATPLSVGSGQVAWLSPQADGTFELTYATVSRVCPPTAHPDCAPIGGSSRHFITLTAPPRAVVRSPSKSQIVVLDAATKTTGGSVFVLAVPTPEPAPSTTNPAPGQSALASPSASGGAESSPSAPSSPLSAERSPSLSPARSASPRPSSNPTPSPRPIPSAPPTASPSPSSLAAPSSLVTASGSISPETSSTPSEEPQSPQPIAPGSAAIISNVVVVGEAAAYSNDGMWFAFSARPADGSQGPDIYVWHVGDATATPVTFDHASVFSGWFGGLVLGSRSTLGALSPSASTGPEASGGPGATDATSTEPLAESSASPPASSLGVPSPSSPAPDQSSVPFGGGDQAASPPATPAVEVTPTSFLIDPLSLVETPLAVPAVWRPAVDPTGRFVVYWSGTIAFDAASGTWLPGTGRLVLDDWQAIAALLPSATAIPAGPVSSESPTISSSQEPDVASPSPVPSTPSGLESSAPSPTLAPEPSASPSAASTPEALLSDIVGAPPLRDWDVRWDPSGTHLAIWIADPSDPALGRLTLFALDPQTGRFLADSPLLEQTPALAGFSIESDHLAWATPPGENGEGSQLEILAWSGTSTGQVESQPAPGDDAVVVVR